jgi:hypothetical protein
LGFFGFPAAIREVGIPNLTYRLHPTTSVTDGDVPEGVRIAKRP